MLFGRKKQDKEKELEQKMEKLLVAINKVYPNTKELIWKSFLAGMFAGLGASIGVSIVLAVITFILGQLKVVPIINAVIDQIQIQQLLKK
jgi:hypothetical protein